MVQSVTIDGRETLRHDVADEAFAGWIEAPIADGGSGAGRRVTFEVQAIAPERGWGWGVAARSAIEFTLRR